MMLQAKPLFYQAVRFGLLGLFAGSLSFSAIAQDALSTVEQIPGNAQILQQSGVGNRTTIEQSVVGSGLSDLLGNTSSILQSGMDNQATLHQFGDGHHGEILQSGATNSATISQNGSQLDARVEQGGDNHSVTINQTGTGGGMPIVVRQF